jgi:glucosylglycerate synthase
VLEPGPLFRQVLSTIFDLMEAYRDKWASTKWSKPTAIFGFGGEKPQMPEPVNINRDKLYQRFKAGFSEYWEIYRIICSKESFQKLREIASLSMEHFEIPEPIWAKIIYDFALAFHRKTPARAQVLDVLVPLYIGMVLSFANKTHDMSLQQADEVLEDMCLHYEQTKPYLIDRWK